MPSIRSILLLGLSICSFCRAEVKPEKNSELSLDEVVRWLPEESVNAALRANLAPKYRDGVFEHGKKAIEAIKNADPRLAAKVVDEALQRELEKPELKKRQDNSTSTTTTTETSSKTEKTTTQKTTTKKTTTTTNGSPNPPPGQFIPLFNPLRFGSFSRSADTRGDIGTAESRMSNSAVRLEPSKSPERPRVIITTLYCGRPNGRIPSASLVLESERLLETTTRTPSEQVVVIRSAAKGDPFLQF